MSLVLKFGGTSVSTSESLRAVGEIIQKKLQTNSPLYVVVSAFGGATDDLIQITHLAEKGQADYKRALFSFIERIHKIAEELLTPSSYEKIRKDLADNHNDLEKVFHGISLVQECSSRSRDYILSFGERNCAYILNRYLVDLGLQSHYVDARNYIFTNDNYGAAEVNFNRTNQAIQTLSEEPGTVKLITGFIGSDNISGRTTTLGRGGSDYTAAIFAAALDADALEIWTDVDGVMTADPRKVRKSLTISSMSYNEALEMSHFGAKVLYAPTIRPVRTAGIPTLIKNTFNPDHPGTIITRVKEKNEGLITGISSIPDISIVSLQGPGLKGVAGIASRLFSVLATANINIIMITQASSEHSISLAVYQRDAENAKRLIENAFRYEMDRNLVDPVRVQNSLSLLAIIGENMKNRPGVSGHLFSTLGKNGINVEAISQGSSELNVTFAVQSEESGRALQSLHDAFFLSSYKTVYLFMIGVGLIGSKLLEQLEQNREQIQASSGIDFRLAGVSNSSRMLIDPIGIDLDSFRERLVEGGEVADLQRFVEKMIEFNLPNCIFIDNTASADIPEYYSAILRSNIAISTPNKVAMSSSMSFYRELKHISVTNHIPLRYETNVAAGLPVLSTIENLMTSGDRIEKIEAVLSGSVSYIFNTYNDQKSFSEIVMEARALGLTEPDPREDLSGQDVKRKILILARETGHKLEMDDIDIVSVLPDHLFDAADTETFLADLPGQNSHFADLYASARENKQKNRFIATFEKGKATVKLKAVGEDSPFFNLTGSDNMIAFHTTRYNKTPLVIRGPGAGADVTSAGVLAELLSISKSL